MRTALTLVSALIFLFLSVPCLYFGSLGVRGRLADVSEAENVRLGVAFLAFGLLAAAPGVLCVLLWRPRGRSQLGRPKPPDLVTAEPHGAPDTGREKR